jgi:hypothetical protein
MWALRSTFFAGPDCAIDVFLPRRPNDNPRSRDSVRSRASRRVSTRHARVFLIAFRTRILMKMVQIVVAAKVVARTGYGEAVRVFDLGPRNERISRGPGDRIVRRTCEGD